jgi:ABC-2 type transport system ATP-binding protein
MHPIIEAAGLVKRFGKHAALDGLDLVAPSGQIVALLGPNGAGKTTFVRSVATLARPDSGSLRVDGLDVVTDARAVRRRIGLAGQYAAVEPTMTGRQNLEMIARLFGQPSRIARASAGAVLERLSLTAAGDQLVRSYSGGMRRRLDLGASLVGSPRLLLLDEPTTGLDPRSRIELWDAIRGLVADGTDVLLTTQYLDEADHLASLIVIIDNGRVVEQGSPAALKARAGRDVVEVHLRRADQLAIAERALQTIAASAPQVDAPTHRIITPVMSGTDGLLGAARALADLAVEVDDIALRRPTLDEVFLAITGPARSAA